MTQQGLRQASVRAVSGTTLTYEGDYHAMWDAQGIAAGTFNERMIRYANTKLSATYTNINDAMQALAVAAGATNFGSIGTYSFALGPVPANSIAPTLSPTTAGVGVLITCGQGTWSNTPTSYAYQWMRGGVDRSGETASTYTTVAGDDGTTITCKVRASNANGPAAGYTTTSNSCAVSSASYLLDTIASAVRAFSTRKLRSAYAGSAIRIRRSNDNAEQDIGFSGENLDTAAITTFVGSNSAFVTTWYDQSGSAANAVQATAALQSRIVNAGTLDVRNSKPSIFNSTANTVDKYLTLGSNIAAVKEAAAVVATSDAAVFSEYVGVISPTGTYGIIGTEGGGRFYNFMATGIPDVDNTGTYLSKHGGILMEVRAFDTAGGVWTAPIRIGNETGAANRNWPGWISEIVVWADVLSSGDRTTLYNNQKAYWGTA